MNRILSLVTLALSLFAGARAAPQVEPRADTKYVFAHHIVGNTAPYTQATWTNDINLAKNSGIDGFALNVGSADYEIAQVKNAYAAAEAVGGFKLFISADMTANPCASAADAVPLRNWVTTYYNHPAQFIYNGKVYFSTFLGNDCMFGQSSVVAGWTNEFKNQLTGAQAVYFVPFFSVDPATFSNYAGLIDGALNWNSGWPIMLNASNSASLGLSSIGGSYLPTVSPWFFTHYGTNSFNKNFIYYEDRWQFTDRWDKLVSERNSFDIVEIVSWNDYGESHYIGPIVKDALPFQPNRGDSDWATGFDHTAWLSLFNYYINAFKSGTTTTPSADKIFLWVRPHTAGATATSDAVPKPTNYQMDSDTVWVVVLATSPATVTLTTGTTTTTNVPAGLSRLSTPIIPGNGASASMTRGSSTVASVSIPSFTFTSSPGKYNYNVHVASN
ncbi:glycoside hydrolase family 71 protein [Peniophora sp. CONT]|nr:glycoside hydrolase family 71 protein [Peniophora sp. CONT]